MDFTESDLVCTDCGNYNKKSAKFCHTCGTKIEVETVAPVVEKESFAKILENERIKAEDELERTGRYRGAEGKEDFRDITKMRWGIAIGGALLLGLGLLMMAQVLQYGFAEIQLKDGTKLYEVICNNYYCNVPDIIFSWAVFGVGLIPTIFGIRYIVKA